MVRTLSSVVELAGIGLVVAGAWLFAPWLGLIVAGFALVLAGLMLDPPRREVVE